MTQIMRGVPVIALTGAAGAGKSTVAEYLESWGFVRIRFAGPLKDMLRAIGLGDREIEGDLKEAPCDLLCGITPRRAMQTLGTEWGRDLIESSLWVNIWRHRVITAARNGAAGIVVEDCRFDNEYHAIRELGGTIWKIERPGHVGTMSAHSSESGAGRMRADRTLINDGDIANLHFAVDAVRHACAFFDTTDMQTSGPLGNSNV